VPELGAIHARVPAGEIRYQSAQSVHGPKQWADSPRPRKSTPSPFVLVPLPGRTRGHACVAVDTGSRRVLHGGDALSNHGMLDGHSRVSAALRTMETFVAYDLKTVRDNHARLADLYWCADPNLAMINAHDPTLYEKMRAEA